MSIELISVYLDKINIKLEENTDLNELIQEITDELQPEQIAVLLESFPLVIREKIWQSFSLETRQDIFVEMKTESRQLLLNSFDDEYCFPLFEKLDATCLLDLSESLNDRFINYAIKNMTAKQRSLYKKAQDYSVDEVGHWQNFQDIQIPKKLKVSSARKICSVNLPVLTEVAYIVDADSVLIGDIAINQLLSADPDSNITDLMNSDFEVLKSSDDIDDAVDKIIFSGKSALAVIDENGCLTGRLDLHFAYKYKEQKNEDLITQAAGLNNEEDLFGSIWLSSKNRAVWLGINLATAFLASWFIGLFEATIQQVVALAVLMPIVASMGGITGSQTITIIIRGLALGQITNSNRKDIVNKELKVGAINGVLWAMVIGIITYLWFDQFLLSLTIFLAILGNIIIASLSGVWVPWVLDKFKIDPALSGAVILTTITDVFGFIAFLGLGTLFLI
ncbi:magnesium transporter [Psychromonas sp. MME2]|uniref:magnesium transporter n=1 Tax=unclassified Psychromonas TaxID=2614957 RepID=UPI00339C197F